VRRKALPLKACVNCKMLVSLKVEICPNCGSRDFTEDWEGIVIILNPEKSELGKAMGKDKPGRYALKVR